jgi:hypothetical protein
VQGNSNTIGGTTTAVCNTIAGNTTDGVLVSALAAGHLQTGRRRPYSWYFCQRAEKRQQGGGRS